MNMKKPTSRSLVRRVTDWFVSVPQEEATGPGSERIDWSRAVPYFLIHAACLGVIWTGWSWPAVAMAVFFYALRVFTLTGFYHRYFSHRAFKVGRVTQFVFAWIGCTSI